MSKNKIFTGPLAEHMADFLKEKRSLGYKYEEQERILHVLDEMSKGSQLATENAGTACYPDPYFCRIPDQTRNPCVPG